MSHLTPGTALDAGCGTGADAVWLAWQGWQVTAVDVSPTGVEQTRALVQQQDAEVADRVTALVAEIAGWRPPRQYDLVISSYVHPELPFADFVERLADAVAPGGELLATVPTSTTPPHIHRAVPPSTPSPRYGCSTPVGGPYWWRRNERVRFCEVRPS